MQQRAVSLPAEHTSMQLDVSAIDPAAVDPTAATAAAALAALHSSAALAATDVGQLHAALRGLRRVTTTLIRAILLPCIPSILLWRCPARLVSSGSTQGLRRQACLRGVRQTARRLQGEAVRQGSRQDL